MKKFITTLLLFIFFTISFAQTDFYNKLSDAALSLTQQKVVYDPKYYVIKYPMGEVPAGKGVCTDVVIRAYRQMEVDLQKEVHEDMLDNFRLYPKNWGRKAPDSNIDHRRVLNLMVFFSRKGTVIPVTQVAKDYLPGDIVCWDLGKGIMHIGLVVDKKSSDGLRT